MCKQSLLNPSYCFVYYAYYFFFSFFLWKVYFAHRLVKFLALIRKYRVSCVLSSSTNIFKIIFKDVLPWIRDFSWCTLCAKECRIIPKPRWTDVCIVLLLGWDWQISWKNEILFLYGQWNYWDRKKINKEKSPNQKPNYKRPIKGAIERNCRLCDFLISTFEWFL